jgi:hypothetical protein
MLAPPCGYLQGKLHEQRFVVHPQIFHGRVVHNCGYNLVSLHKLFEIFGCFLRQIAGYRRFFGAALGGLAAALLGAGVNIFFDVHKHLGGINVVNLCYGAVCQIGNYGVHYIELQR